MIISPPFLPAPIAGESDEAFLDRAMVGGIPGDGGFPLSFDLNWHGGIHLTAPQEAGAPLPVRAIADGTVVYFRKPTEESSNPEHPLHYMDGWTDDGCIVLKHETEIGEGDNAKVVYYSIYMHLSKINLANPSVGQVVYRKDSIGEAGKIYGKAGRIHFEIIADQTQIANLTGRTTRELDYQSGNGRTDSCWGDMYFFVPPELLAYSAPPTNRTQAENTSAVAYRCPAMPAATTQEGATSTESAPAQVTPDGYEWAAASQLQHGIFVRMSYEKGQCKLTSYYLSGDVIGTQEEEADFEYNLYSKASTLYPQSPSAGYELLRFGRVLGPDILRPTDAAHWRQIKVPGKSGEESRGAWVNLNAPTVTKFSDADFPHWQGWYLVDDDTDKDSHCQSAFIRNLLNLDEGKVVADNGDAVSIATSPAYDALSPDEQKKLSERYVRERTLNMSRLTSSETQSRIRRLVCKFPTEWSANDFDDRYGWLQKVAEGGPLTSDQYGKLKRHQEALAFWKNVNLDQVIKKHWHFPPRYFIQVFRKCGWLSKKELTQIIPKNIIRKPGSHNSNTHGVWEQPNINYAINFINTHLLEINKSLQKFLITTPMRQACFFGNSTQETGWFRYMKESNGNSPTLHSGWYGRGLLQLTNPNGNLGNGNNNYYKYFKFLGRTPVVPASANEIAWRNEIGETSRHACHSAGAYWVWPNKSAPTASNPDRPLVGNTNLYADTPATNSRRTIQTNAGIKTWYFNQSFTNCATAVNYPSTTGSPSPNMNGLVDRSTAFINALIVLADRPTFGTTTDALSDTPEDYIRRETQ
ncbi:MULTISPECIES: M23 family metallopeptidase [unclassified Pseudomonas]|uniref:M23 family metallopeptidase n=1 Tax=unclassified Pseudomonas TaxID=196821 RepID=UPI0009F5F825|nr:MULTISPECIES: M23 family metallopeptidase [unclassified Pseudomonas]QOF86795.1 M23 family metallopeptidase [Pseudomonas sp. ADPe]